MTKSWCHCLLLLTIVIQSFVTVAQTQDIYQIETSHLTNNHVTNNALAIDHSANTQLENASSNSVRAASTHSLSAYSQSTYEPNEPAKNTHHHNNHNNLDNLVEQSAFYSHQHAQTFVDASQHHSFSNDGDESCESSEDCQHCGHCHSAHLQWLLNQESLTIAQVKITSSYFNFQISYQNTASSLYRPPIS